MVQKFVKKNQLLGRRQQSICNGGQVIYIYIYKMLGKNDYSRCQQHTRHESSKNRESQLTQKSYCKKFNDKSRTSRTSLFFQKAKKKHIIIFYSIVIFF